MTEVSALSGLFLPFFFSEGIDLRIYESKKIYLAISDHMFCSNLLPLGLLQLLATPLQKSQAGALVPSRDFSRTPPSRGSPKIARVARRCTCRRRASMPWPGPSASAKWSLGSSLDGEMVRCEAKWIHRKMVIQ